MKRFNFSYFPNEKELLRDVDIALKLQCKHNVVEEIKASILDTSRKDFEYTVEDWNVDCSGLDLLESISSGKRTVFDMSEHERESIAILWVNYMCEQMRGDIVNTLGKMLNNKVDYKKNAIDIIQNSLEINQDDEAEYMGAVLYLWTLICVTRAFQKMAEETASPPLFKNVSLN